MIRTFLEKIRQLFPSSKRYYFAKDILGGRAELDEVVFVGFHQEVTINIHKDIVVLIVSNNFVADPSLILSHFRYHYDFTIDEFAILAYKLGTVAKMYIEEPVLLLEDAIKLKGVFAESTTKQLKQLLDHQVIHNENVFKQKFDEFRIKLEKDKKQSKLRAEDIDADKKIDDWLKRNKKS